MLLGLGTWFADVRSDNVTMLSFGVASSMAEEGPNLARGILLVVASD